MRVGARKERSDKSQKISNSGSRVVVVAVVAGCVDFAFPSGGTMPARSAICDWVPPTLDGIYRFWPRAERESLAGVEVSEIIVILYVLLHYSGLEPEARDNVELGSQRSRARLERFINI